MIIKKIDYDKKEKLYTVYFENKNIEVRQGTLIKFNLYVGKELDRDMTEEFKYFDQYDTAKNLALRYLKNMKSEYQVRFYLKTKDFEENIIDQVIDYLYSIKYLDDLDYARAYSLDRQNIYKYGKNKIIFKLREKQIPEKFIDIALMELSEDVEIENLRKSIVVKKKTLKSTDKNYYYKLVNSMFNKGFDIDLIKKVLREDFDE